MSGYWQNQKGTAFFGHRRLSIIDLSPAGTQPMESASGRFSICLNGEIYNHAALRGGLVSHGYPFKGASDTETLLALIDIEGIDSALRKSKGMFAFALWDRDHERLSLVRDRAGEKPVFYFESGGTVAFASELGAIIECARPKLELCPDGLRYYLSKGYLPNDASIFKGVKKVLPGEIVSFSNDTSVTREFYWKWDQGAYSDVKTVAEARETLADLLRQSVSQQMVSDVPLGAFLSGGIDSSLIVSEMTSLSSSPVKTFSVGFEDPRFDESQYANRVAKLLGTEHHLVRICEKDLLDLVPEAIGKYDEPFADSSQIPTYFIMKYARQFVTVCLSGDGGDELFLGYERYQKASQLWNRAKTIPRTLRPAVGKSIRFAVDQMSRLAPNRLSEVSKERYGRYARAIENGSFEYFYDTMISTWQDWEPILVGDCEQKSFPGETSDPADASSRMRQTDFAGYLSGDILVKVDRAAMGVSLETRVPLLDREIIDFAFSIDPNWHEHEMGPKSLLKSILYERLPRSLFERPKKGFSIPLASWLRGPLRDWADGLLDELENDQLLNGDLVRRYWNQHQSGQEDWHTRIWNVLMYLAWKQRNGI